MYLYFKKIDAKNVQKTFESRFCIKHFNKFIFYQE